MRVEDVRIAEPCHEDWEGMRPTSRGRYCDACTKQVYDLSKLTEAQATALLDSDDDVCVSYQFDEEGDAVFRPPAALIPATLIPVSRLRRSPAIAPAALVPAAGLVLALAACAPHGQPEPLEIELDTPAQHEPAPVQIPEAEPCEAPPAVAEEPEEQPDEGEVAPPPATEPVRHVKGRMPRKTGKKIPSRVVGLGG